MGTKGSGVFIGHRPPSGPTARLQRVSIKGPNPFVSFPTTTTPLRTHQVQIGQVEALNQPLLYDRVAVDGNVLSYLIQANTLGYDPSTDPDKKLAPERKAAFRLLLYLPCIYLVPTISEEIENIPDLNLRKQHTEVRDILFDEVLNLNNEAVNDLAVTYYDLHKSRKDCRLVAEAKLGCLDVLLTFDQDLIKHLSGYTDQLMLTTPSAYWGGLDHSRPPKWVPHPAHPLYNAGWWKW